MDVIDMKHAGFPNLESQQSKTQDTFCIFFLNCKSGGKDGSKALKLVQNDRFKGKAVGFDLAKIGKNENFLEELKSIIIENSSKSIKVVVGGGDGSIRWILTILDKLHSDEEFLSHSKPLPLAILPLGVGNELSRCTGWSSQFNFPYFASSKAHLERYIGFVSRGKEFMMDRWNVDVTRSSQPVQPIALETEKGVAKPDGFLSGSEFMLCFLSIGFDSDITQKFHELREKRPQYTFSRGVNKFWYTALGVEQMYKKFPNVSEFLEISVDGQSIPLPPNLRSLQVFNIHTSGDGVDFFGASRPCCKKDLLQKFERPTVSDGLLEIAGTESIYHFLKARFGKSHSRRLAQGHEVVIRVRGVGEDFIGKNEFPLQIDGEAFAVERGTKIKITHRDRFRVIEGNGPTKGVYHDNCEHT